ncbi:MAG TPA: aspartate aminotransferase family protein [Lentisphaeria bacterium]|nr:MAG: hypothetical protein A2X47_11205 [Lentisphaerae bacterium GWF2_38_69]HBM16358.1 aspartate aminotransferase family protein [Lentisphaeria bacterium]
MNRYTESLEAQKNFVMPTYSQSIMLVEGKGSFVWDSNGKKYIDFTCGISVCNLGHSHKAISKAISKQSKKLVHVSNLYMNDIQPLLAKKLVENSLDGTVFFCNSGAEANEGMIKFARKWGNSKGKYIVISMENSFHGRTLATLSATGRDKYRKGFEPRVDGFIQVPFNDMESLAQAVENSGNKVAAIILEPVQGEGGIIPAEIEYMKKLRTYCDEKEILLMFDEVQSGMGRTGKLFAYQNYDIEPDLISMAKALGNGYPIGAFIASRKLGEILTSGTHASTFGGTPLACSAAMATLEIFKHDKVLENCLKMGEYAKKQLNKLKVRFPIVKDVRGVGLMIGVELAEKAQDVCKLSQKEGLLIITAGENTLRFYPPLNISKSVLRKGISILNQVLIKIQNNSI